VSDRITLSLRAPLDSRLEAECVSADRLAALSEREISGLPVWVGRQSARLGDFFDVRGDHSSRVCVEGELGNVDRLGAGMSSGELLVAGDAGDHLAEGMAGGLVEVRGSVRDDAGVGMRGGTLRIDGRAGDRLGAAPPGASRGMTGGEIVVDGSVGRETAARCRRGLVAVGGDVDAGAARSMIAGTLLVFGQAGDDPARGNRRGSLVVMGAIDVPATYRYACTFQPPHLRLLLTYLGRRYNLAIGGRLLESHYRRYCGEAGASGRGEILVRVSD
jgi:formylmethanofuran dehydrogenase subunit C